MNPPCSPIQMEFLMRYLSLFVALAVATPSFADSIFDGKSTTGWKAKDPAKSKWKVGTAKLDDKDAGKIVFTEGTGELVNTTGGGTDIYTEEKFGDCTVELEFMVPKGSNSGVYMMGVYEVQIL